MKAPSFGNRQELARYIEDTDRLSGNRPAVSAFIDLPGVNAADHHLSVNSLEIETLKQMAAYHRNRAKPINGKAAFCVHKVHVYSEAARKAAIPVTFNHTNAKWEFVGLDGSSEEAYRYRPVQPHGSPLIGSPSHCGIEYVRVMKAHSAAKFARRLVGTKFHEF